MISNKEEARAFCESYMNASKAFQACRNVPSIDSSKAIASCILDITVKKNAYTKQYLIIQFKFISSAEASWNVGSVQIYCQQ